MRRSSSAPTTPRTSSTRRSRGTRRLPRRTRRFGWRRTRATLRRRPRPRNGRRTRRSTSWSRRGHRGTSKGPPCPGPLIWSVATWLSQGSVPFARAGVPDARRAQEVRRDGRAAGAHAARDAAGGARLGDHVLPQERDSRTAREARAVHAHLAARRRAARRAGAAVDLRARPDDLAPGEPHAPAVSVHRISSPSHEPYSVSPV
jgi:hypothetical protein